MKHYNTLTRSKEEFDIKDKKVRMYVCGPTVYNYIHIGNARCFVVFDMLRRYLEKLGNEVVFVQNFTDVDDKMINRAKAEGCTVPEIAERYIAEYRKDAEGLGVRPATFHPRATENIDEIIGIVSDLIARGHAYVSGGNVYFSAESFPHYGCLSHYNLDELEAGARIDVNDEKRHPFDFALWKAKKEDTEISWDSPWGPGRPGWHIECSAMVKKYLGTNIDIHCGGQDLTFPHHENEIAQSECATGEPLARFWLHNGYINVDNRKMSKSAGDCFWVRDAAKEFGYGAIRFFLLSSHYRNPVNYSRSILEQSAAAMERLANCLGNIAFRLENSSLSQMTETEKAAVSALSAREREVDEALADDFNTANAIAALFEITRDINTLLKDDSLSHAALAEVYDFYSSLLDFFGFIPEANNASSEDDEIDALVAERTAAKKNKDYKTADAIRERLAGMGITLEDTPQGTRWKRN